jgi:hypothetical protein
MGIIGSLQSGFSELVPPLLQPAFIVFFLALVIVLYALFTYSFYTYLSRRDLLQLNLAQYNQTDHEFFKKFFAVLLFLLEYLLFLPFASIFWFSILTIFFLVLAPEVAFSQVLLLSGASVCAVRMLAYYKESLSKEIAKIIPLTLLTLSLINPAILRFARTDITPETFASQLPFIASILVLLVAEEFIARILYIAVRDD